MRQSVWGTWLGSAALALLLPSPGVAADAPSSPAAPATAARSSTQVPRAQPRRRSSPPPLRAFVDMATLMEHVLTPAATIVWRSNGFVNDAAGDHDLSPKTDADWEQVVTGAATLAESTNALLVPERILDPEWVRYVQELAALANRAYLAAEQHDQKALADVSDHLDEACAACHRHYHVE